MLEKYSYVLLKGGNNFDSCVIAHVCCYGSIVECNDKHLLYKSHDMTSFYFYYFGGNVF
jgi:hypothetical protein